MPSLEIFGKILTTSPWGQDDLHCLCVALGSFRVVQIAVLIPMWAYLYVLKVRVRTARRFVSLAHLPV